MTVAIVGTVGVPAGYGGFETLADNLVVFREDNNLPVDIAVYCTTKGKARDQFPPTYRRAELRYISLNANGVFSILYDSMSLFSAIRRRDDTVLLLGVSGAIALPLFKALSTARVITNIDGIEWRRDKWSKLSRWFLRFSERMAIRFSDEVVADNIGIGQYVYSAYGRKCHVIAYGGDHSVRAVRRKYAGVLPERYALALCRIEPENNVAMILDAFAISADLPLVFIGNWGGSKFGRELREKYASLPHLHLLDPIYDLGVLRTIREGADVYVHGHSAGGTNPSLVETMHFGLPVVAYDCVFNRYTTDERAMYFEDVVTLKECIEGLKSDVAKRIGGEMLAIAKERYTWDVIGRAYFRLLLEGEGRIT